MDPVIPDIKANGSDGPLTIFTTDFASLEIALDAGSYADYDADWWVIANTPAGYYSYDYDFVAQSGSWQPGLSSFIYQGPLFDLPLYHLTDVHNLQIGMYTFYFVVDYPMDGIIDLSCTFCDSVDVKVKSPFASVPEPSTLMYLLTGFSGMVLLRWRLKTVFKNN
jgi:hypothetical protein